MKIIVPNAVMSSSRTHLRPCWGLAHTIKGYQPDWTSSSSGPPVNQPSATVTDSVKEGPTTSTAKAKGKAPKQTGIKRGPAITRKLSTKATKRPSATQRDAVSLVSLQNLQRTVRALETKYVSLLEEVESLRKDVDTDSGPTPAPASTPDASITHLMFLMMKSTRTPSPFYDVIVTLTDSPPAAKQQFECVISGQCPAQAGCLERPLCDQQLPLSSSSLDRLKSQPIAAGDQSKRLDQSFAKC